MASGKQDKSSPSSPPGAGGIRGWPWYELALILAVFFIVGGAPAPHVNETHYLVKARHYWDASYCPGDYFLDSADPHLTFYWTVGWLTRWVSLPAAAWMGRIAAWALLAAAWQRLSRTVVAAPWSALLSGTLWVVLINYCNFAGEWVVGGVEAKCFAYACVLMGLAAMARGRWTAPWIWFGAAAAMHVLVGAWAVLAALGVYVTEPRGRLPSIRKMIIGLVAGGVLSLPGLLPALALERGVDSATASEAARIYVFERLPHHLAPLTLGREELTSHAVAFGMMTVAFFGLWVWTQRQQFVGADPTPEIAGDSPSATLRLMRFAGFALLANLAGLALEAALVNHPLAAARVLRYYWFRQADVAVPLAVALAGTCLTGMLLWLDSRWIRVLGIAPIAWCCWSLGDMAVERWRQPIPPGAKRVESLDDWQAACAWIRNNAPTEAVFLVPRWAHSFKWYAARADVANYKDVPQDAASVVEWRRRYRALFPTIDFHGQPRVLDSPEKLGTRKVQQLAEEYGATHVIARSYPPLDLPIVYPSAADGEYPHYTIYSTTVSAEDEGE